MVVDPGGPAPLLERIRVLLEQLSGDLDGAGSLVATFPGHVGIGPELVHPAPSHRVRFRLRGTEPRLEFEPVLLGHRTRGLGRHSVRRLELALLVKEQTVAPGGPFDPSAATALWRMADAARRALDVPVLLTSDDNEGRAQEALSSGVGHVFDFDLACAPRDPGLRHHHPPFDYRIEALADCDAAYRITRFDRPPWS